MIKVKSFFIALMFFIIASADASESCNEVKQLSNSLALKDFSISWLGQNGEINSCISNSAIKNSPFEAASLSKPILSVITMKLIEDGHFELDDKLPDVANHESFPSKFKSVVDMPEFSQLTVRSVLSHKTGLPNWRDGESLEFYKAPNTEFSYSGEAFELLQFAIEANQQKSLEELAQDIVFQPLKMNRTSFVSAHRKPLVGHNLVGKKLPISSVFKPSAAFSLVTTSNDYLKFLVGLVTGDLMSARSIELLSMPHSIETAVDTSISWGLGFLIDSYNEETVFAHTGSNPGFKAFAAINKSATSGIVYLSNSDLGSVIDQTLIDKFTELASASRFYDWLDCEKCMEKAKLIHALDQGKTDLPLDGSSFEEKTDIGYLFAEAGRQKPANRLFYILNNNNQNHIEILFGKAVIQMRKGNLKRAEGYLDQVLNKNPNAENAINMRNGIKNINSQKGTRFYISGFENAESVFLRGDFNSWNRFSLPMKKINGGWERFVSLEHGEYKFIYNVDDAWLAAPDIEKHVNKFGKSYSLIKAGERAMQYEQ